MERARRTACGGASRAPRAGRRRPWSRDGVGRSGLEHANRELRHVLLQVGVVELDLASALPELLLDLLGVRIVGLALDGPGLVERLAPADPGEDHPQVPVAQAVAEEEQMGVADAIAQGHRDLDRDVAL